jgi:hypothetical protein
VTEKTPFNDLLDAMPRISEAVNSFSSEEVQRRAFDTLVGAFGLPAAPTPAPIRLLASPASEAEQADGESTEVDAKQARSVARRSRRTVAKKVPAGRDLNFRPEGKESLRDFVDRTQPATIHERNLAAVYYLERVLEISDINAADVQLAYRSCSWREPSDPVAALRTTASRRKWLNTSNSRAITTTAHGRNTVEHDMPIKRDKKPA